MKRSISAAVGAFLASFSAYSETANSVTPIQVVETMEATGHHPGFRRNHAKGV